MNELPFEADDAVLGAVHDQITLDAGKYACLAIGSMKCRVRFEVQSHLGVLRSAAGPQKCLWQQCEQIYGLPVVFLQLLPIPRLCA